jgi:ATP-dependent helicase/nuclease subunit A
MFRLRQRAVQPSVIFRTATAEARTESEIGDSEGKVQVIEVPRDPERPAGTRFGALVHATLAAVPLDASDDQVRQVTFLHARILGADEREVTAATSVVQSVLAYSLMIQAREAVSRGHCRRETPVTVNLADGTLVEGVLDLAFLEKDEWTVVDFKTDRELEKEVERYKRQVALYALSIERATGQGCAGVLMKI